MAYGDIIYSTRYNNLQNRISAILGTSGAGTSGYGQTNLASGQVSLGAVITKEHANNLRSDMLRAIQHQTGANEAGASYIFPVSDVSTANSTITIVGHAFTNGVPVVLAPTYDATGVRSTAPGGINYDTVYYVRDVSGNTFKLAAVLNGTALTFTSQGSGSSGHEIFSGFPTYDNTKRVTEAAFVNFESKISTIENNKLNIGSGQFSIESPPTAGITSVRTTQWNGQLIHAATVDFGSAAAARYFFNAGGKLRFYATLTGGDGSSIYNDWNTLLTNAGVTSMDYTQTTSTGSGTVYAIGFYDLTTANQVIYTKSGSGSYAANDYTIYARCDVANNANGGARYVYFTIYFNDDKTVNPNFDENVTGTLTSYVDQVRPSGTNVSLPSPTYANTTELSGVTASPTYAVSGTPTSGNESTSFTFSVTTTNVANGTVLYWSIDSVAGVLEAADFSDALGLQNSVTISSNAASFVKTMRPDGNAEGTEQFRIRLFSDAGRTALVAISNTVSVANSG